jgi:hypothetical protein
MPRWLVIIRPLVFRAGVGFVEGPATLRADPIYASDRAAAEAQLPKATKRERYAVVAECSWRLMTTQERDGLLAGSPSVPPPHPKAHDRNAYREVTP